MVDHGKLCHNHALTIVNHRFVNWHLRSAMFPVTLHIPKLPSKYHTFPWMSFQPISISKSVDDIPGNHLNVIRIKGALDKYNIILQLFPKKIGIFIPLEVLVCVMTACWVLRSRLTYFWRNMNISSRFHISKSISINTQYSTSLWDTRKMMLFIKYLIKGKMQWQNQLKISVMV